MLISKVLQSLANGVTFGDKEEFMKVMNPYILENINTLTKFLDDVSVNLATL